MGRKHRGNKATDAVHVNPKVNVHIDLEPNAPTCLQTPEEKRASVQCSGVGFIRASNLQIYF